MSTETKFNEGDKVFYKPRKAVATVIRSIGYYGNIRHKYLVRFDEPIAVKYTNGTYKMSDELVDWDRCFAPLGSLTEVLYGE